jgi:hypothetical protein
MMMCKTRSLESGPDAWYGVNLFTAADSSEEARLEAARLIPRLSLPNDSAPHLYILLEEPEQALSYLEGMYQRHSMNLPEQLHRKLFEPLQDDPRFIELKSKTGLDRPPAATD